MLSKLCQGLPSFAAEKLHLGFSEEMVKESQEKLKINKVSYETNKKQTKITINFKECLCRKKYDKPNHLLSDIPFTCFEFCFVKTISLKMYILIVQ